MEVSFSSFSGSSSPYLYDLESGYGSDCFSDASEDIDGIPPFRTFFEEFSRPIHTPQVQADPERRARNDGKGQLSNFLSATLRADPPELAEEECVCCPVCLETIIMPQYGESNQSVLHLACGHPLHLVCAVSCWKVGKQKKCPLCRKEIADLEFPIITRGAGSSLNLSPAPSLYRDIPGMTWNFLPSQATAERHPRPDITLSQFSSLDFCLPSEEPRRISHAIRVEAAEIQRNSLEVQLCLVLCLSSRVSDLELNIIKNVLSFAIVSLESRDQLCIIGTEDGMARMFCAMLRMDEAGKLEALHTLRNIRADANLTSMSTCISIALDQYRNSTICGPRAIYILSDLQGDATEVNEIVRVVETVAVKVPFYTIGLSPRSDGHFLGHLAEITQGMYSYAENAQSAASSISSLFYRLLSMAALDVKLKISPSPYAILTSSTPALLEADVGPCISLGHISSGEKRSIVLDFDARASPSGPPGALPICTITCEFTSVQSSQERATVELQVSLPVRATGPLLPGSHAQTVKGESLRMSAARTVLDGLHLSRESDDIATEFVGYIDDEVSRIAAVPNCSNLSKDFKTCKQLFRDRPAGWSSAARAIAMAHSSQVYNARCTGYSTPSVSRYMQRLSRFVSDTTAPPPPPSPVAAAHGAPTHTPDVS